MIIVKIYLGISLELFGSVQFQIVPCSSLYFFSRSIDPFQNLVNVNYRVVVPVVSRVVPSSLFILASFVCKSLQCLISALKPMEEGGHLFRLTCSVVLWGGRNTANKYHWHVWWVLAVYGPLWVSKLIVCESIHNIHNWYNFFLVA